MVQVLCCVITKVKRATTRTRVASLGRDNIFNNQRNSPAAKIFPKVVSLVLLESNKRAVALFMTFSYKLHISLKFVDKPITHNFKTPYRG